MSMIHAKEKRNVAEMTMTYWIEQVLNSPQQLELGQSEAGIQESFLSLPM